MNRYLYTYRTRSNRVRTFGPYESEDEANEAFQRRYGYWPTSLLSIEDYTVGA